MQERNTGYTLLSVGIAVMVITVLIIILTFIGILKPIGLFNITAPSFNTASLAPSIPGLPAPAGQEIKIIPTDAFNKMLNLGVEFLLMTFILSFGYKIADLGVKLIRPIKITEHTVS